MLPLALLLTITSGIASGPPARDTVATAPNIILYIVDDMGWQDTSVPFHTEPTPFNRRYKTPAMEKLASSGMMFTQAYSASPVCTPTRTSIMTGRHPARTHITNWTLRNDLDAQETGPSDYPLHSPEWNFVGLGREDTTLPRLLGKRGYRTIHVGKAHFGALDTPGADPTTLGFDVNIAGHAAGGPGSYYARYDFSAAWRGGGRVWDVPGLEAYHGLNLYLTDALTVEARRAITDAVHEGQPFFLNMAHYAVHAPIEADSQYVNGYDRLDPREAAYASMVEGMDRSLGAILETLELLGVAEETLIVFTSDNGGLSAHARGGDPHTHNAPLRSGKGSAYEGGTRVPTIISWAGVNPDSPAQQRLSIPPGSRSDTPMISHDLFPTILQAAGAEDPRASSPGLDGISLMPVLTGTAAVPYERLLGWHYPHKWGPEGPGLDPFSSIRRGDWKLIYFYKDKIFELYNLAEDIGEARNRLAEEPAIARSLRDAMGSWMADMGAQVPVDQQTREPVTIPDIGYR